MSTLAYHANPGGRGAVLLKIKKKWVKKRSDRQFFTKIIGLYLTLPQLSRSLSSNYSYSLSSSQLLPSFLKISISSCSFGMKFLFPFSRSEFLLTLRSHLTPPSISFSSLSLPSSPVFLVFSLLPPRVLLGMSRHAQESKREERGWTHGCDRVQRWQVGGVNWGQGSGTGQYDTSR